MGCATVLPVFSIHETQLRCSHEANRYLCSGGPEPPSWLANRSSRSRWQAERRLARPAGLRPATPGLEGPLSIGYARRLFYDGVRLRCSVPFHGEILPHSEAVLWSSDNRSRRSRLRINGGDVWASTLSAVSRLLEARFAWSCGIDLNELVIDTRHTSEEHAMPANEVAQKPYHGAVEEPRGPRAASVDHPRPARSGGRRIHNTCRQKLTALAKGICCARSRLTSVRSC